MALAPFDESKDKITERELVFDIFERLKLGKQLKTGNTVLNNAGTKITEVLGKIIAFALPLSVVQSYLNIKTGYIHISPGDRSGSTTISGAQHIAHAISQQTGEDVTSCLSTAVASGNITVTMTVDSAYKSEEYIKIYAY